MFKHIASADPSTDLLSLVQSINPDLVFSGYWGRRGPVATFLSWLKVVSRFPKSCHALTLRQTFTPSPERLIAIWEDYALMALCDYLWWKETREWREKAYKRVTGGFEYSDYEGWISLDEDHLEFDEKVYPDCPAIVSRVMLDRDMLRIIYAYKVTAIGTKSGGGDFLFRTRFLLGLSWDELRGVLGS
jgi:hypothetical protein